MPQVSRFFIKSGLLFMVASLIVAVVMAAPESWNLPRWSAALGTTQLHLFVVGWITQIIFGVAIWFFPNWTREQPRGRPWVNWSCFATLNAGLVLRAISETAMAAGYGGAGWAWAMSIAAILHVLAALLFAATIWPRVKGRKKRRRG